MTTAASPVEIPCPLRGTYAHPRTFWERGARLEDYGVNAVFIHGGSLDADTATRVRAEGCRVYAEFATVYLGLTSEEDSP